MRPAPERRGPVDRAVLGDGPGGLRFGPQRAGCHHLGCGAVVVDAGYRYCAEHTRKLGRYVGNGPVADALRRHVQGTPRTVHGMMVSLGKGLARARRQRGLSAEHSIACQRGDVGAARYCYPCRAATERAQHPGRQAPARGPK